MLINQLGLELIGVLVDMDGNSLNNITEYFNNMKKEIEANEIRELINASPTIRNIINRKDSKIRALQHDVNSLKAKLYDEICKHA